MLVAFPDTHPGRAGAFGQQDSEDLASTTTTAERFYKKNRHSHPACRLERQSKRYLPQGRPSPDPDILYHKRLRKFG